MIAGLLRLASTVATLLVVAGFAAFAIAETGEGSSSTVTRIAEAGGPDAGERARESEHGAVREALDDANDVLLEPFAGLVSDSGSEWARRGVPAALAFLAYGVLLRMLANALPAGRRPEPIGWEVPR